MSEIGTCTCDTRETHPVTECVPPGQSAEETWWGDVRDLLVVLGLGDHARPYSPHAVIHREILPVLRGLHDFATDMINAPDDSAADWGYDLAHRLGLLNVDGSR